MKASRFNMFNTYENGVILGYNSQTAGLIELDKKEYDAYQELAAGATPDFLTAEETAAITAELTKGSFLIGDEIDELTQVKASYNVHRFLTQSVGITVVVTHRCNLACTYCYEERQPVSLGEKHIPVIARIVEDTIQERRAKKFDVTWFGGEPLLRMKFIESLSEKIIKICEREKCDYSSRVVTNGTLLTRPVAEKLRALKITDAQITLDGPPEVHDARRITTGGKGTFGKIIRNIKNVHDLIRISIRVNVDVDNVEPAARILDVLKTEELEQVLDIHFAPVNALTKKCSVFENKCISREDFSPTEVTLAERTIKKGFRIDKTVCLPKKMALGCGAVSPHNMIIDAKGYIHKCWMPLGDKSEAIGELNVGGRAASRKKPDMLIRPFKNDNISKWLAHEPFYFEKCVGCNLLPTCMGGCPWAVIVLGQEPMCPTWKFNIKERLWLYRQCLEQESAAPAES